MADSTSRVRVPWYPLYSTVAVLIDLLKDVPLEYVKNMIKSIDQQMGTPQNPVDWSMPDSWIPERLVGKNKELALKIWHGSNGKVNPRHIYGSYNLINTYKLLDVDEYMVYHLTEQGIGFINGDEGVLRQIDEKEGLLKLLSIIAPKTLVKRADILPEWSAYLNEYSSYGTVSTISDTMWRRVQNLVDRGYLTRKGVKYSITEKGKAYVGEIRKDALTDVLQIMNSYNDKRREEFKEFLQTMHPYHFEKLISQLLEAMGYIDVITTKQSGDKGVDVVGNVEVGITSVREVVQVKRVQSNVQRQTLDQLRGSLPYHEAIRGTIITLSDFSKGCAEASMFPGAAPITLINGEKLLELLEEYQLGIRSLPVSILEIDKEYFDLFDTKESDSTDVFGDIEAVNN